MYVEMPIAGCVYSCNVLVRVHSRCSSHPLQCDESCEGGEELVEGEDKGGKSGGTDLLSLHTSVNRG